MSIQKRLENLYQDANQKTGERLEIIQKTIEHFGEKRGAQAAASLAYYALFSLFPLMLSLISLGSYFLKSEEIYQQVVTTLYQAIPVSQELISQNLSRVLEARGTVGLLGLASLIWAASGVFSGLAYNVNLAWDETEARNFLEQRLVAFAMIGVLLILFLLSFAFETLVTFLPTFEIPLLGGVDIYTTRIWRVLSNLIPWIFIFLLYSGLYRWVPNRSVNWRAALWSAIFTATAWQLLTSVFTWYLGSGLSRYEVVYGSLGAVVALMFLIYLIGWITLFGAHLCVSIQTWIDQHES